MTVNNWSNLAVTGRVDLDALTVGGAAIVASSTGAALTPASVTTSGTVSAGKIVTASNAPAAADSVGVAGTIAWDATHIYVCVATDTWVRADLAAWV
jgi:hypothetical protein